MNPDLFPIIEDALANVNGVTMPLSEVRISPMDRGFLFGDAVYEVLRVYHGKLWLADEHFRRLEQSLASIRIQGIDIPRLRSRVESTLKETGYQDALVYLQITRGAAPRKHPFPKDTTPLELLYVQKITDPYVEARKKGAAVITVANQRWSRCDVKSTNLLANVLASQEAMDAGCLEAIFYLPDGTLTEGSHTNLFGVRDGALVTAPSTSAILPGITRGLIVDLARAVDLPVVEDYLRREELDTLEELFVSGTTTEVMPVVTVDGKTVKEGSPGPVTLRLQEAYQDKVAALG